MSDKTEEPDCAHINYGAYVLRDVGDTYGHTGRGHCNGCKYSLAFKTVTLDITEHKVRASIVCPKCGHINTVMEAAPSLMTCEPYRSPEHTYSTQAAS